MKKKQLMIGFLVFFVAVAAICFGVFFGQFQAQKHAQSKLDDLKDMTQSIVQDTIPEQTEPAVPIPEKDMDFAALQQENPDIYGWIYVPGTEIDYPLLQHPDNDEYYLNHNVDGSAGYPGTIYTEPSVNSKDFSDFNTVIYGHNMKNGTMFATLHYYADKSFFDENRYVFIYTPEKNYAFEIFAAYTYNDRHLLKGKDLSTDEQLESYIDEFYAQGGNYAEDMERITPDDHIITLSTCTYSDEKRWLVQAVLVN